MEFLKALTQAKELGLTKEEFIPIWKLEANIKASELEDQQPIKSPVSHTNSDRAAAESLLQQQSQKIDQEMTDMKQCLQMHSQHLQNMIQEKQTILLEEIDRKQTTMKEEFGRHFEILTKFVSNTVESQTGCLKRFFVQEMELMQQNLQRKIEDIAEPRETEANGASTSLNTGITDSTKMSLIESDTFPGQYQVVPELQPGQQYGQQVHLNQQDRGPAQSRKNNIAEVLARDHKDKQHDTQVKIQAIQGEPNHEEHYMQCTPVKEQTLTSQPMQHMEKQSLLSLRDQYPKQVEMRQQQTKLDVKHVEQTKVSKTSTSASSTCSSAQSDVSEDTDQTEGVQAEMDSVPAKGFYAKAISHLARGDSSTPTKIRSAFGSQENVSHGGLLKRQTMSRLTISLNNLSTLTPISNDLNHKERSEIPAEIMPENGVTFTIPRSEEFMFSGKDYFSSSFLAPSKSCKARVLIRFDTKSKLRIDLLVSCGENADRVTWPIHFSSTGYIYNTGSKEYTWIWLAENRALKRPTPGTETAVQAVVCLWTLRATHTYVTYEELERKLYAGDNCLQFEWFLDIKEKPCKK